MTGDIEAAGDALTGGLIGRAVEPRHGEQGESHEAVCLNCATGLAGPYCHNCGQAAHVHRSLAAIWHDIAHSVLHFEGKVWRTLPLLAFRPGELTRRYIHGERARFVSPMALFLFSVFLMFAVFSLVGGPFTSSPATSATARAEADEALDEERADALAELERLRARRTERAAAGRDTAGLDAEIETLERTLAVQGEVQRWVNPAADKMAAGGQAAPPSDWTRTGIGWVDKAIEKARGNPALIAYKLQTNAYKFSWALIPISVPFLWLMFLHRRRYRRFKAYDHTVFVTYSIAFMSLALVALSLTRPILGEDSILELAILLVPPVHMYRQLRGAYGLSRRSALWRTVLLVNFAFVAAGLFFSLLLTLGAFG